MNKITLNEFIEQSALFLGRKLTREEVESIQPCECGQEVCSGWTGAFTPEPVFIVGRLRV